jgi:hypothetical protein
MDNKVKRLSLRRYEWPSDGRSVEATHAISGIHPTPGAAIIENAVRSREGRGLLLQLLRLS